jgi:hypothetical protein
VRGVRRGRRSLRLDGVAAAVFPAEPERGVYNNALLARDLGAGARAAAVAAMEGWFKGGSEPGVLTLTYLVKTADHRTLVDAVMLANPRAPIPQPATAEALALARGGIRLAGG